MMMRKAIKRTIKVFLLTLLACACSTTGTNFKKAPLYGMVYDYENNPCAYAQIYIDDDDGPKTDINGRFIIEDLERGNHIIKFEKSGYELKVVDFDFVNKTQVLYVKMISLNYLLKQAENSLEIRKIKEANQFLVRAEAINPEDPVLLYMKSIYFIKIREYDKAIALLTIMLNKGYDEAAVHLALADIYQFYLDKPETAVNHLKTALSIQEDPLVRKRLESLENK